MIVAHTFIPYKGRKIKQTQPLFPGNTLPGGGCGCSTCATGDDGAFNKGELEATDPAEYESLIERLQRAVEIVKTTDHYKRWMTGDEEEGHPFHGNQYTGGLGAKPTETKVTGVKSGVHELLSSGHSFSMEELQKATGATTIKQISDALAMLKNPKYAGSKGTLKIEKGPEGFFVANAAGQPVAPPPVEQPKPEVPALAEATPTPTHAPSKTEALPPSTPMSKADADKVYADQMKSAMTQVQKYALDTSVPVESTAMAFKNLKAAQMAQWKANTTGIAVKPKAQVVYEADKELIADLAHGAHIDDAMKEWKSNTAKEKAGTWPASAVAAKQAVLAEQQKKEQAGLSAAQKAKQEAALAEVAKASSTAHEPHFPQVSDYVPADHSHIDAKEFTDGTFSKNINKLKSTLQDGHTDKVGNKVGIQHALTARLKDSKAFQEVSEFYKKKGGNYGGSLEAQLISTWASTSADTHPVSIANQMAVRDAFAMDADDVAVGSASSHLKSSDDTQYQMAAAQLGYPTSTQAQLKTFKAALRDFALAQYHNTQEHLAAKGIDHVYVARGMKNSTEGPARIDTVKMQPVSSFSANFGTAKQFAGGGTMYFVKVPRSQVFSSYVTGFGCTNEHEVCVLAHPTMTAVRMKSSHAGSSTGTAAEYASQTLQMSESFKAEFAAAKAKSSAAAAKKAAKTAHWYKPPPKPKSAKVGGYAKKAYTAASNNNLAGLQEVVEQLKVHSPNAWENATANPQGTTNAYVKHLQQAMEAHHASEKYKMGSGGITHKALTEEPDKLAGTKYAAKPEWTPAQQAALGPASNPGTLPGTTPAAKAPAHLASHPHFNPSDYHKWQAQGKTDFQIGKTLAMMKFKAKQKALAEHVLGAAA